MASGGQGSRWPQHLPSAAIWAAMLLERPSGRALHWRRAGDSLLYAQPGGAMTILRPFTSPAAPGPWGLFSPGVPITPRAGAACSVHSPSVQVSCLLHFQPAMSSANTTGRIGKTTCPRGLSLSLKSLKGNYHRVKRLMRIS